MLVLTTTLPVRPGDGTPAFVLDCAAALANRFEVTVIAPMVAGAARREIIGEVRISRVRYLPWGGEALAREAILPSLRARPARALEVPPMLLAMFCAAARFVARNRRTVINAHWILPSGLIARMLRASFRVPYVVTVHGADAYAMRGRPWSWLKSSVLSRASAVAPVSEEIALMLSDGHRRLTCDVIPMGVDIDAIVAATAPRRPEAGRVLFVGRLAEKKGVDVLIKSLEALPEAHAVIVGDGPERQRLERQAHAAGLTSRVNFMGQQPQAVVFEEMRRAALIAVPSRRAKDGDQDGTPVVLAEAMAAGVPVVASEVGGIREQLLNGISAVLVKPDSAPALADGIRSVLSDPSSASARALRARDVAASNLSLEGLRQRYERIFVAASIDMGWRCE